MVFNTRISASNFPTMQRAVRICKYMILSRSIDLQKKYVLIVSSRVRGLGLHTLPWVMSIWFNYKCKTQYKHDRQYYRRFLIITIIFQQFLTWKRDGNFQPTNETFCQTHWLPSYRVCHLSNSKFASETPTNLFESKNAQQFIHRIRLTMSISTNQFQLRGSLKCWIYQLVFICKFWFYF